MERGEIAIEPLRAHQVEAQVRREVEAMILDLRPITTDYEPKRNPKAHTRSRPA